MSNIFYIRDQQKKVLQFEKYIAPLFKIDMNIFVIYKTTNKKTPTKGNQHNHKGDKKHKIKDTSSTFNKSGQLCLRSNRSELFIK